MTQESPSINDESLDLWKGLRGENKSYKPQFNVYQNLQKFEILDKISEILAKTFGPHGSTTIIEDRQMHHVATKDGYTLLKYLTSSNDLERVILEFVKRTSMRLVRVVGDGSTSAVVVSAEIAKSIKKFMEDHPEIYTGDLMNALSTISEEIQKRVMSYAVQINDDNMDKLTDVMRISTNNNIEMSQLITEVYKKVGKHGSVHVQPGDSYQTGIEYKTGFHMYRGYCDPIFANKKLEDREFCELENARVIMVEGPICGRDIETLSKIMSFVFDNNMGSFVLIANEYSPDALEFARQNVIRSRQKGMPIPICFCEHGIKTREGSNHFSDIATYLGCHVVQYLSLAENLDKAFLDKNGNVDAGLFEYRAGFSKRAVIRDLEAVFFEGAGVNGPDYKILKADLEKQIDKLGKSETKYDFDQQIAALKVRYDRLCACSAVISVGGKSKAEIETNAFLAEDAVLSARSALENGVIPAGNIMAAMVTHDDAVQNEIAEVVGKIGYITTDNAKDLVKMIHDAFIRVFMIVSKLSFEEVVDRLNRKVIFNVRTRKDEPIDSTVVLNSARTDKEIIQGALSVVGLISTSNQFIFAPKQY
jgi:chaperonin GroEL